MRLVSFIQFFEQSLEMRKPLDIAIVPVGGGGLLAGSCLSGHHLNPEMKIIAAEPEMANDAYLSWKSGSFVPAPDRVNTIADGLKTSLGKLNWPIIKQHIDQVITVSEQEIKIALQFVWERMKIVIEPSAAVGIAVVMFKLPKEEMESKNIGIVFSGGNLDLSGFFQSF
jgi:threonine dehydratase